MGDLERFTAEVGEWGKQTFPESTPATIVAHLRDEVLELAEAIEAGKRLGTQAEAADCLILLSHLAHRLGFDLMRAARLKQDRNYVRQWESKRNARGYFSHVRGAEDGE